MLELRRNDYELDDHHEVLRDSLRELLTRHSDMATVRSAEPIGHSPALWNRLAASGFTGLGISEELDGQGGGLIELMVAAGEIGRFLAPVPLSDHYVATRLLAQSPQRPERLDVASFIDGSSIATILPRRLTARSALVPSGAVATCVVAWHEGRLVALLRPEPPAWAENDYGSALAWWSLDDPVVETLVLDDGPVAEQAWLVARDEWRCLHAAQLAHLTRRAGQIAQEYAVERSAFGRKIAQFQAVSHQLVGIEVAAATAENIASKAAWFCENEPAQRPELATMAVVNAIRTAMAQTAAAIQTHGGFGITTEADVSVFYRRAQAWAAAAGPMRELLADLDSAVDRFATRATTLQTEGAR